MRRGRFPLLQLLVLIIPFAAVLLAIVLGAQALHFDALQRLVSERDVRVAQTVANAVSDRLQAYETAVASLALQADALNDIGHAFDDGQLLFPGFDNGLAHVSADGSLEQHAGRDDYWRGSGVRDALAALAESSPGTSDRHVIVVADSPGGEKSVLVGSALEDGTYLAGAVTLETLMDQALGDAFDRPDGQVSLMLVDGDNEVLYGAGATGSERAIDDKVATVARAHTGQSDALIAGDADSGLSVAYGQVPDTSWTLILQEPWQVVDDPILVATELVPLVLIPTLILVLGALWFLIKQVIRPLRSLEMQTAQMAQGNYGAVETPIGGIREVKNLQAELGRMARRVNRAQQSLRDYLGVVTQAQEEERGRLARDLHDDTIQSLVVLTRKSQLARASLNGQPQAAQLDDIENMAKKIIDDLRRVSRALRPVYLDELGLSSALGMLAYDTSAHAGLPVSFASSGDERRLRPDVELALYRMAQEVLSNAVRHAEASAIIMQLDVQPDMVTQSISDNGCGFLVPADLSEIAPGGHFGLLGLHERADLIGAKLRIESKPGQGTRVTVSLPLAAPEHASK